jgi:hypothetical protein
VGLQLRPCRVCQAHQVYRMRLACHRCRQQVYQRRKEQRRPRSLRASRFRPFPARPRSRSPVSNRLFPRRIRSHRWDSPRFHLMPTRLAEARHRFSRLPRNRPSRASQYISRTLILRHHHRCTHLPFTRLQLRRGHTGHRHLLRMYSRRQYLQYLLIPHCPPQARRCTQRVRLRGAQRTPEYMCC